ncbi:hypothetical protein M409DRAFT_62187 [Zasmidium cellare ATCC 36951]|uniref:Uncharacterized protein n=1 Tax=Zasmidium cellare ATCC 36951 TaxID=1080233 RepID=A0A6A6D8L6_ZASCE|nr:uncharacterized protein M409DRAFT_62187 [Zasmidium cellare ATCC 36951]KAF2173986.1 hypothetical protein M409DRAFT_62187 [Zasmidium cellare ATCC 36951]
MAAYYGQAIGRSLSGGSRLEQILLPNGACSYRDLNAGVKAPTCGCRRFWLNKSHVVNQESERAWCFCGHHACFHDNVVPAGNAQSNPQPAGLAVNTFPSSHQANGASQNGGFVPPTWSSLIGDHDNPYTGQPRPASTRPTTGLGIRNTTEPQAESINSRLWYALNGFARLQEGGNSGDTSKLPSTAVPSVYDDLGRASPSQALREHVQQSRLMGPPVNIPPINIAEAPADEYSATEVATPSIRGTPDFRATHFPAVQPGQSPAQPRNVAPPRSLPQNATNQANSLPNPTEPTPPPTTTMGPSLSIQEMCNTIQDYGRRINILEGVSFSHMPSDEVQEKFDLQDSRLIDLESWRTEQDEARAADDNDERMEGVGRRLDELETWRSEHERSKSSQEDYEVPESSENKRRRLLPDASSLASDDGSFDENAAAQTEAVVLATLAANAETGPRIDALESRIASLEHVAMPSAARPWHISVVVLPFGRQLPGIWFSSSESTQHSIRTATQTSEDWPTHQSMLKTSFRSNASSGAWTTESIEAWAKQTEDEWLSPKACGPSGTVFQRLASRGLVRDVVLQSPDPHHIVNAISNAFGNVIRQQGPPEGDIVHKYQGLQARLIPLRKQRKSSRLRFLSPAEMVTPATWTAEFLEASVFMKVNDGERRLYLTTTEGYTQPARLGWTWPELRSLPAFDVDGIVQEAQIDGDIVEACWTYNDRLDHSTSLHSSFASSHEESGWDVSEDDGHEVDKDDVVMLSPTATRHSRVRSASLPSSAVEAEVAPKRRVASFELEPTASTFEYSPEYIAKRRRISTSPELERRGVNFTPRWSREPPSPYLQEEIGHTRSSQATNRPRGTTPFAYATPHIPIAPSEDGEDTDEWQGVQDGPNSQGLHEKLDERPDGKHHQMDEEDMEDGLSIYEA